MLKKLEGLSGSEKWALLRSMVVSGQLTIRDIVALAPDLTGQDLGATAFEGRNEFNLSGSPPENLSNFEPDSPQEAARGVWMFTTIVLSGLGIAGVVAYLIAHHIAH